MDLKSKIRTALKETYGDFKTNLENEYRDKVIHILVEGSFENKQEWVTYNQVILELNII